MVAWDEAAASFDRSMWVTGKTAFWVFLLLWGAGLPPGSALLLSLDLGALLLLFLIPWTFARRVEQAFVEELFKIERLRYFGIYIEPPVPETVTFWDHWEAFWEVFQDPPRLFWDDLSDALLEAVVDLVKFVCGGLLLWVFSPGAKVWRWVKRQFNPPRSPSEVLFGLCYDIWIKVDYHV